MIRVACVTTPWAAVENIFAIFCATAAAYREGAIPGKSAMPFSMQA
jgi:hypothetical protein